MAQTAHLGHVHQTSLAAVGAPASSVLDSLAGSASRGGPLLLAGVDPWHMPLRAEVAGAGGGARLLRVGHHFGSGQARLVPSLVVTFVDPGDGRWRPLSSEDPFGEKVVARATDGAATVLDAAGQRALAAVCDEWLANVARAYPLGPRA